MEHLVWELEKAEMELWQVLPDPILEKFVALLSEKISEWSGTPTELAEALKLEFYAMDSKENPKETESFDLLFRGFEITTGG